MPRPLLCSAEVVTAYPRTTIACIPGLFINFVGHDIHYAACHSLIHIERRPFADT